MIQLKNNILLFIRIIIHLKSMFHNFDELQALKSFSRRCFVEPRVFAGSIDYDPDEEIYDVSELVAEKFQTISSYVSHTSFLSPRYCFYPRRKLLFKFWVVLFNDLDGIHLDPYHSASSNTE